MIGYIIRRLLAMIPILFGVSVLVFFLARVMPGNIAQIKAGLNADPAVVKALEHQYGLDKPVLVQYGDWMKGLATGDLGQSLYLGGSVKGEIVSRLPVTIELLLLTVGISTVLGLSLGIFSALYYRRPLDSLLRAFSILGMALPSFWVAILIILIPSLLWSYAKPLDHSSFFHNPWSNFREFGPPAVALGLGSACGLGRIVRGSILGVLRQDFMRTARAKGLSESVIVRRHALGNVMLPIVTIIGLQITGLLGGAVIIEQVFNLNGVGSLLYQACFTRDYPVIQGMALYIALVVVLLFLAMDVAYAWLDPRVRLAGGSHG